MNDANMLPWNQLRPGEGAYALAVSQSPNVACVLVLFWQRAGSIASCDAVEERGANAV
jgi:hypothetical protein